MQTYAGASQHKKQQVSAAFSGGPAKRGPAYVLQDNRPQTVVQKKNANATKQQASEALSQQTTGGAAYYLKDNRAQAVLQRQQVNAIAKKQATVQKKTNNTGLPDQLKSGIENLSGYSMDDVKVHYNSTKPAQLQAHAYAQGTDIHIASGQEKHLPHEAWHVVQQKQGRVMPTMQLKEKVNVNDDKNLEKEADVMGAKAMQLKTHTNKKPVILQNLRPATVQRKVGFEFESTGENKWRFQGKNNAYENWAGISNTKAILLDTPNGKAGASADNGNVEFVTRPLSTWEEVASTFGEMEQMVDAMKRGKQAPGITILEGAENAYAQTKTNFSMNRIDSKGSDILAKPQATIGVSMMNIHDLFTSLVNMNQGSGPKQDQAPFDFDPAVGSNTAAYQVQTCAGESVEVMKRACEDAHIVWEDLSEIVRLETTGLVAIIFKILYDAFSNSGPELTDPKYAFPLMPRTDFRSMLQTMNPESRELFSRLWTGGELERVINMLYPLDQPVFPGKYTGTDHRRHSGPTKKAWIDSIVTGAGPKDLLSPPPFFPAHADTPDPEGMGAYGADGDLALFELRDLASLNDKVPVEDWINIAMAVCRLVAEVEGPRELDPPLG